MSYWLCRYWWKNENKYDTFIKGGIWQHGNPQANKTSIGRVEIGDCFALFDSKSIKAIGKVRKKTEEWGKFIVDWYLYGCDIKIPNPPGKEGRGQEIIYEIKGEDPARDIIQNELKKYEEKKMALVNDYKKLLEHSRNIILHGAPGTGKTYLARQIAESMGAETCFVQFHPSYDYTDFVEGLRTRPKEEDSDESSEIGFERKDGVFKKFCKKALLNSFINTVDNFEYSWKKLVETLINEERIEIPLIKDKTKKIKVELTRSGEGLRSCEESPKYFNKNQLYKVYRGLPGVPTGGHDYYRKAIVQYMKDNCELKEYKPGEKSQENKNFVFIIDEINRGEMSKIFGELFFSIDPGYRGEKGNVLTQYANMQTEPNDFDIALEHKNDGNYGHFFVPENVYIIGTMNDIDRNVESMDFAIRRRFAFKEIKATDTQNMLDNHKGLNGTKPEETIIDVKTQQGTVKTTVIDRMKNRMNNLNNAISGIDGLSSAYHMGASYFLQFKLPSDYKDKNEEKEKKNAENAAFEDLWNYHLEPLLQEYLRGMEDADSKLKALKAAYENDNKAK